MFTTDPITTTIEELVLLLRGASICALTGAGISTDSGIPDYRGPQGSLKRRQPVTFQEFFRSEESRRHYWARSCTGWPFMRSRKPNDAHAAIARLQRDGLITGLITQNVDGLHRKAGSPRGIELHGGLERVICLDCGEVSSRDVFQQRMLELNPGWLNRSAEMAPDGDAELAQQATAGFVVPVCERCGGVMKPDVVFFGENVPVSRVESASAVIDAADALLVCGSSLTVYSGYRFADRAHRSGKPIAIINQGPTRADSIATRILQAPVGAALPELARQLAAS